jgi:hypothetical protein
MQSTVHHRRYRTAGGMENMGMHNRSENGHSARVTLSAYPTQSVYLEHILIGAYILGKFQ